MDPLSALAIAAAVVQFVDFSAKLISRGRAKRKGSTTAVPESGFERVELEKLSQELTLFTSKVHDASNGIPYDGTTESGARLQFAQLGDECNSIAMEFQAVLAQLRDGRPGISVGLAKFWTKPLPRNPEPSSDDVHPPFRGFWSNEQGSAMRMRLDELRARVETALLFSLWYVQLLQVIFAYVLPLFHSLDAVLPTTG
jgi:hypothetical protein